MAENVMTKPLEQPASQQDEYNLVKAARDDPQAFGLLYLLYINRVVRYLHGRLGNVRDAEDIAAQTFISAFEAFDQFRQEKHFSSWLFTIARNKTIDHYRRQRELLPFEDAEVTGEYSDPQKQLELADNLRALSRLILSLPEDEQELLRLRYLAEMSYPEMARLLHRREAAVKKSVYRLLARLQSRMEVSNE